MKILVIGAKGMLGSMVMEVLADWQPTGWDVGEIDITKPDEVIEKITSFAPTVVINAAAYTNVDGAEGNRAEAFAVNEGGVENLAAAAKKVGARFVHYSTDYVFPGTKKEGYAEDDEAGPAVNIYGESKLAGEKALMQGGVNFYLVRTAWLYGPRGNPTSPEDTRGKGNFVGTMLRLGKDKKELNVVSDQHGSPTYTKDVALATKQLLEEKKPFGVYHAVCTGQATWFEFAQEIFRLAKMDVHVRPIPASQYRTAAKRPEYSMLLNTKGLAMRGWQEALQDYMKGIV